MAGAARGHPGGDGVPLPRPRPNPRHPRWYGRAMRTWYGRAMRTWYGRAMRTGRRRGHSAAPSGWPQGLRSISYIGAAKSYELHIRPSSYDLAAPTYEMLLRGLCPAESLTNLMPSVEEYQRTVVRSRGGSPPRRARALATDFASFGSRMGSSGPARRTTRATRRTLRRRRRCAGARVANCELERVARWTTPADLSGRRSMKCASATCGMLAVSFCMRMIQERNLRERCTRMYMCEHSLHNEFCTMRGENDKMLCAQESWRLGGCTHSNKLAH